jgi:hypothetical protein
MLLLTDTFKEYDRTSEVVKTCTVFALLSSSFGQLPKSFSLTLLSALTGPSQVLNGAPFYTLAI